MLYRIVRWALGPLVRLDAWLERRGRPPRPGQMSATLVSEVSMLRYRITFPPVTAGDTATREVTTVVTENGGEPATTTATYPAADASFEASFNRGAAVTLTLVDIDGDGNRSPASEPFTFTATDTIPPPQPGSFQMELIDDGSTPAG